MRIDKRKLLGPLFTPLSRAKHSRVSRIITAVAQAPKNIFLFRMTRPFFFVDVWGRRGFGAVIVNGLLCCDYAEKNNLAPVIISSNRLYSSEPFGDCLAEYFYSSTVFQDRKNRAIRLKTLYTFFFLKFPERISIDSANRLFHTYFKPKQNLIDEIESVLIKIEKRKFDLSIHYRGTDKALEAPLVDFQKFTEAIRSIESESGILNSIFLATDDPGFDAYIRSEFSGSKFFTYNRGEPVDSSRGRHFSDLSPADKSLEALVNIFLISASPTCIRSASYLSAVSKIVNPQLVTLTMNRTHWGSIAFPECEIVAEERERSASLGAEERRRDAITSSNN